MTEIDRTQPGDFIALFAALQRTGALSFGVNELNLRSLIDDPPKYTLESASPALGAWSARYVLPNGSPVELALIQFKKDERTRGRDDLLYGEWTIHLKGPETPENPDGMMLVFYAVHDYVWAKWLSPQPYPVPPALRVPPKPPVPDGPTPEQRAEWKRWADAIVAEFLAIEPRLEIDPKNVQAVLDGRTPPDEFHRDLVTRVGAHNPDAHPSGAPY